MKNAKNLRTISGKKWTKREEAVIWQALQTVPQKTAALQEAANLLEKSYNCVRSHYYSRMEPLLKKALLEKAGSYGRPIPMKQIEEIADRFGLNPIWVNSFWGNLCKTQVGNPVDSDQNPGDGNREKIDVDALLRENENLKAENAHLKAELASMEERAGLLDLKGFYYDDYGTLWAAYILMTRKYLAAKRLNMACLRRLSDINSKIRGEYPITMITKADNVAEARGEQLC